MITRLAGVLMVAFAALSGGSLQFALRWLPSHTSSSSSGGANARFLRVASARLVAAIVGATLLLDGAVLVLFAHYTAYFGAPSSLLHVGRAALGGVLRLVYLTLFVLPGISTAARSE